MNPRVTIYCGDVAEVSARLDTASYDASLTDSPYELKFLAQTWDSTAVSCRPETWEGILRVCKPGAHLLAFSGSRTCHRIACAIEEGGWTIRDTLQWLRGHGVPKGRRDVTAEMQKEAMRWRGYGTSLKPAHDPIVLAQKPRDGTYAQNAVRWGCGLLNLADCRIPGTGKAVFPHGTYTSQGLFKLGSKRFDEDLHPESRYPTNVILDEEAARLLDEQETGASRFYYCSRASTAEKNEGLPLGTANGHPCAKPLRLCQYLATLILPPARETPRRLLVPFCGSGSEIIGALLAGWDEVVGIETNTAYIDIAEYRIRHWVPATATCKGGQKW